MRGRDLIPTDTSSLEAFRVRR